ncbi:hypothetical protein ABT095_17715 [Kitasatospora sp. NPDC002227]|uniref:hypothetical protein n=1 Tax=Kitasatospora sp. NPDC002227 TaxID=3154773 RepID=UPI0033305EDA
MNPTTPPRPVDIAAVFPELVPLARPAVRLHPRVGKPTVHDSSVGGPLLWPAGEPWPVCAGPHPEDELPVSAADIRRRREIHATRPIDWSYLPEWTEALDATYTGHEWSTAPNALQPVVQLYRRDVPALPCPEGADLLQVLWCPLDHEPEWIPAVRLFWRAAAGVREVVAAPPEPAGFSQHGGYLPEPCVLHPETVTDYPDPLELDRLAPGLTERIEDWCEAEYAKGSPALQKYHDEEEARAFYQYELSSAPGWKLGGWAPGGDRDPMEAYCETCGALMTPFLSLDSTEEFGNSWDVPGGMADIGVDISGGQAVQLHLCPVSFDHPFQEFMR